jgi:hypothetical protein
MRWHLRNRETDCDLRAASGWLGEIDAPTGGEHPLPQTDQPETVATRKRIKR